MLLNLSPLRRYREFRLLFIGQTVSLLGSLLTYVAVPYQIYELTNSSWLVGMVSAAQLLPVLALGLLGPGPLQANMVHPYLRRRAGRERAMAYCARAAQPVARAPLPRVSPAVHRADSFVAGQHADLCGSSLPDL